MRTLNQPFERAMALAALSGFKIALGPAFLSASRHRPDSWKWVMGAVAEMTLDKLGVFPPRYRPSLLIPHALAGAWVARESMREDGEDDPNAAIMGGVVAAGVAISAPIVRIAVNKILGVPDAMLGLAEDYIALQIGSQATDVSINQLPELVRESVSEVSGHVMPALQSAGVR